MIESDEEMFECAKRLKKYCTGIRGDCTGCAGCLFNTDNNACILVSFIPSDWDLDALLKKKTIELLKEIREDIIRSNENEVVENKVTALDMAIEALKG